MTRRLRYATLAALLLAAAGCDRADTPAVLPGEEEIRTAYAESVGIDSAELSGNVAVVRIRQPDAQLRRGGSLWARVGPYIYLFSPSTQRLFESYPDLAAVRIVTLGPGNEEVARALLRRDALSGIQWRRSLNLLGHALQEGTQRPSRLEDLVTWGERHTEYEYNEEFLPN